MLAALRRHDFAFSAALSRGLIEAHHRFTAYGSRPGFSAALSRGLIEARTRPGGARSGEGRFSAALSRGLIEAGIAELGRYAYRFVFRGFKPRPH